MLSLLSLLLRCNHHDDGESISDVFFLDDDDGESISNVFF